MTEQEFQFDFRDMAPQEAKVALPGGKFYLLREASGGAVAKWRNVQLQNVTIGENGKPKSLGNMADLEAVLLGECLYEMSEDGTVANRPVGADVARMMPDRMSTQLYAWVMKASGLTTEKSEEKEEELGNS